MRTMRTMKMLLGLCALLLGTAALTTQAAGKPVDKDGDGYKSNVDCNDNDSSVWVVNSCGECAVEPAGGCGGPTCTDNDLDDFALEGGSCGPVDCNDGINSIFPGATEICGDGIDQDCSGADLSCGGGTNPHANLTWSQYPTSCMSCHNDISKHGDQYSEVFNSTHYQWMGAAPDMVNQPESQQGKLTNAVNSYCINITGDWPVCGSCHAGRGAKPGTEAGNPLANVDCLVCHNADYAMSRVRLADGSMGPPAGTLSTTLDSYVRNIAPPTRANCLSCHAKAGGGDGVKRGDLSLALIANADAHFDVHMNTAGPDLQCQDCHVFQNHKVIGKGSDLHHTDDPSRGSEITCSNSTCHVGMDSGTGHASAGRRSEPDRHVARVACQSCHIPTYAKFPTEIHRDWQFHHGDPAPIPADEFASPGHPLLEKASNLVPEYRFWNRLSNNYLLGDVAAIDPETGAYPTSRPLGDINDQGLYTDGTPITKLTPFKYKTATQPITDSGKLIALDTFEYLKLSGNATASVQSGLLNMVSLGLLSTNKTSDMSYSWIETDTYQMINHGVNPVGSVAECSQCHGNGAVDMTKDSMLDLMGYKLKGPKQQVCNQCHDGSKRPPNTWDRMHNHVNKGSTGIGCYFCHDFDRPERGLCNPCDEFCASEYVDTVAFPHQCEP